MRNGLTVGGCRVEHWGLTRATRAGVGEDGRRFGLWDRIFKALAPPKGNAPLHPASAGPGGMSEGTVREGT